jgi:hypothetical protein
MAGEPRNHRDVGIDRVPDRNAFIRFDDVVVFFHPFRRLALIDEGEGERSHAVPCRLVDGVAPGAGDPQRRVRLLHRLRHQVAAGHGEVLALVAGVGVHHQHVGCLGGRLQPPHHHRSQTTPQECIAQCHECRVGRAPETGAHLMIQPTLSWLENLADWGGSSPLIEANWFAGRSPSFSGRRQPSRDGTSRMMREYPVPDL